MDKMVMIDVADNKISYIKASSIESVEINKVEMNELKYVICITTNSGKEFNSKIYDGCSNVQDKVDGMLQFMFGGMIKDDDVYVLD